MTTVDKAVNNVEKEVRSAAIESEKFSRGAEAVRQSSGRLMSANQSQG